MGEETLLSDLVLNSRLPKVFLRETRPSCHNVCESQVSQVSFGPSLVSFMSVPLMAVSSSSHIEIKLEGQEGELSVGSDEWQRRFQHPELLNS